MTPSKHWSRVEYLHESVRNPNIHIRGTHSYYSDAWSGSFEQSVVRYLYGDEYSLQAWDPLWPIDQLYIGDYVCIGAQAVILMGGNHTHRMDWFSLYPFVETLERGNVRGAASLAVRQRFWRFAGGRRAFRCKQDLIAIVVARVLRNFLMLQCDNHGVGPESKRAINFLPEKPCEQSYRHAA